MKLVLQNYLLKSKLLVITTLLIFFTSIFSLAADRQNTNTPEAQRILNYLNVIKSGDREVVRNFISEQYDSAFLQRIPIDMHVTIQMGFYYMSAGLGYDFNNTIASGNNELKASLTNKLTGAQIELRIPLNNQSPARINNFIEFKAVLSQLETGKSGKLTDKEILKRLEKCMSLLIKDDEFSGAVMFAKNGNPLFNKAFGLSNKSDMIPNKTGTKFNIASVGKIFTAVAIAQLAEQGKLSFDDPINKYISADWLNPEVSGKIQIKHLLTHTSGLGDYFRQMYTQCDKFLFRDLDDYKIIVKDQTSAFEPGTKWSYSNTGALLLGVIIEKITGKSYFDYLHENIFMPAKMINTGGYDKDSPVPNRALGYTKSYSGNEINWTDNSITRFVKGTPSGGCYSSVEDMLKFDIAFRSNKLLSKEYTELILSPKPEINSTFHGYGFFTDHNSAGRIAKHGGDGTGISCQFSMYLDSGYTVVVLSNYNRPAADIVNEVIGQMIGAGF